MWLRVGMRPADFPTACDFVRRRLLQMRAEQQCARSARYMHTRTRSIRTFMAVHARTVYLDVLYIFHNVYLNAYWLLNTNAKVYGWCDRIHVCN